MIKQFLISALFFTCIVNAQQIEKFSIDSGGASVLVNGKQLLYTIGEVSIQELNAGNIVVSEGFINSETSISLTVSENEIEDLVMYPNPVDNVLNINTNEEIIQIRVYNQLGQLLKDEKPLQSNFSIDFSNLTTGIYLLKIKAENKMTTKQVIKR